MYYDRKGEPISMDRWVELSVSEYKRIDSTELPGDVLVSTVWLGLNHSWLGGPPLIFETMVFGGRLHGEMDRYATEAEAQAGHVVMVKRVEATLPVQLRPS